MTPQERRIYHRAYSAGWSAGSRSAERKARFIPSDELKQRQEVWLKKYMAEHPTPPKPKKGKNL